jgi:hypothetical protein
MRLLDFLFLLCYLKLSDVFISNQIIFRSFHCSSLALLSLKNTIHYGLTNIVDPYSSIQKLYSNSSLSLIFFEKNEENDYQDFYLKIIPFYFFSYIMYDLKNCYKRCDLFIHHIVCLIWVLLNYAYYLGLISLIIMAEGVTFAYFIRVQKYQYMYRLLFTLFIRFPIWIKHIHLTIYYIYYYEYEILNLCIFIFMFFMDCLWFKQNLNKIKQFY